MTMNGFNFSWRKVLFLTSYKTARTRHNILVLLVRMNGKTEQKSRSLIYCERLTVTAMLVLTPASGSRQMQQPPERHGRQWNGCINGGCGATSAERY